MGEDLEHKCGVTFLALRKHPDYFPKDFIKTKQRIMLLKSRNRGQQAAGIATVNPYAHSRTEYMPVEKVISRGPSDNVIEALFNGLKYDHIGTASIGHVRYSTYGGDDICCAHPVERAHQRPTKRFAIVENGNHTNTPEQQDHLEGLGLQLTSDSDMETISAAMAQALRKEHRRLEGENWDSKKVYDEIDLARVIQDASKYWEGGYTLATILGNGDSAIWVDPFNIRPCCYYIDEDIVVAASETRVITSAFPNIKPENIKHLEPGQILVVKKDGSYKFDLLPDLPEPRIRKPCHFELQYFSRPGSTDWGMSVYRYRTLIAKSLAEKIHKIVPNIDENTVVCPVPNTSIPIAYWVAHYLSEITGKKIHSEMGITKDDAARGFITKSGEREEFISLAYDPVYEVLDGRKVIVIDDTIVRGTTAKKRIIPCLVQGGAEGIYLVSADAPIKYPCAYGIDMSELGKFIYFDALIELLKEKGLEHRLDKTYEEAIRQRGSRRPVNLLESLYELIPQNEICERIAQNLRPEGWVGILEVIYNDRQGIKDAGRILDPNVDLLTCCLDGKHPYDGGYRVINNALINFMEGKDGRSY